MRSTGIISLNLVWMFAVLGTARADDSTQTIDSTATDETATETSEDTTHPMDRKARFIAAFRVGFGGNLAIAGASQNAEPTTAFMGRMEFPIGPYFALGAMAQMSFANGSVLDRAGVQSTNLFDLGMVLRGRYLFNFGTIGVEPSLAIPVGPSLGVFDDRLNGDPGPGWHIGVLLGAQLLIGRHFGVLLELGWMRHAITFKSGEQDGLKFTVSQGSMVLGALVTF